MKRNIAFILVFIMLFSFCVCSANVDKTVTTLQVKTTPYGTAKSETSPVMISSGNDEIDRAISLGIVPEEIQTNLDEVITFKQFCTMTENMIALYDKNLREEWKKTAKLAYDSDEIMLRQHGMLALLYAAQIMGIADYNITPVSKEHAMNDEAMWNKMLWDYPMFPNWEDNMDIEWDKDLNHMTAAVMFAMRRASKWTNITIFDWDDEISLHVDYRLTRKIAILAVERLLDSQLSESESDALLAKTIPDVDKKEVEKILAAANVRREAIKNSKTEVTLSRKAYYVSNSGNDKNDGLTKDTPWATVKKVDEARLKPGDAVFFERGGLWRGTQLITQEGVTYSAYGTGDKPKFYISPENGADPNKWSLLEGTDSIWVYYKNMEDCGNVVFNDGETCGTKELPFYTGSKFVLRYDHNTAFDIIKELDQNLDFFTPADSNLPKELPFYQFRNGYTEGKVYLRCNEGNPGKVFKSIEFLTPTWSAALSDNCVIDNLCFMYTGGCGVSGGKNGVTVQNCEFGWVGGCLSSYDPNDTNEGGSIQGGDAIKIDGENNSCIGNYVHDVYDYGMTAETGYLGYFITKDQKNLTYKGNLLERCGGSILIFNWEEPPNPEHLFINIKIEDNYAIYNGYGNWKRMKNYSSSALNFFQYPNANKGIYVTNNVFYLSKSGPLICCKMSEKYAPVLSGNTYIQKPLGKLAIWRTTGDEGYNVSDENIIKTLKEEIGDKEGTILKYVEVK